MGIWITLRQNNQQSFFRDNLLGMISRKGDLEGTRLLLASGYFSEYPRDQYSICSDKLKIAIRSNRKIQEIDVIGGKGSKTTFERFCSKLGQLGRPSFIPIRIPGSNWHAKIAMILKPEQGTARGTIPVCAIIGSSNLTRPAFGITPAPAGVASEVHFNYECDVLIFSNNYFSGIREKSPIEKVFPRINEKTDGSIYFPKIDEKYSLSEEIQLMGLFHQIKNSSEECKEKL